MALTIQYSDGAKKDNRLRYSDLNPGEIFFIPADEKDGVTEPDILILGDETDESDDRYCTSLATGRTWAPGSNTVVIRVDATLTVAPIRW